MIGVLGGTFDPIHYGHLRTALEVVEHFGLSSLRLIPGNVPPHRQQPVATPQQRLTMLQLATARTSCLQVDDRELRRPGYSYSVDTLASLRQEIGQEMPLLFTLGVDAFLKFQEWHRWHDILVQAHLVVVQRPSYSLPPTGWYESRLSTDLNVLRNTPAGRIYPFAVTALDISATRLRDTIRLGKNPRYLLPDDVIDYIYTHQLYCNV